MLIIVAISVGYYFIKENEKKTPQVINYKTVEANKTDLSVYVSAEGHIVKTVNEWPDYKDFAVQIMVDELEINQIKEKQAANVHVEAVDNKIYKGKVSDIDEKGIINGSVTSYKVTIDLENDNDLKENMSVSADVLVALEKMILTIPIEAVQTDKQDKNYVYIVDENKQKKKIWIETGKHNTKSIQVVKGLTEGQPVIIP
ncbi:HlyD family efflux transporter periplasmic adaptor subunit [Listeria innocua]|uniref:efflux RND transporter periplasmic adaptor subunit n=1 Tax=Listeria innocua TaxID=1642 RepID=UPI0010D2F797|nr:HlyD family efflux transporter periplasmic adaptor subunit [Listeria innocua]EAE2473121.1 HlyD family efflux transporter periplasmic adaptor subunit [Listeria innocua]EDO1143163.1 HlyD family efflux transporter periplasmic adaptor subunit [Listeria innocua]EDO1147029.1 HlyD family efflux transporter periplasmic adaptor subunit [Listeria innocua]EKM1326973.1 HlyD family efflux transporter periplasmic adaptor subunit [Listeria innocua]EKM1461839.1 HlyD family efflux transporter periplasmic ad